MNRKAVLTHAAFLSLWSLRTLVAQGPRDTCGHTRIAQPCFPPKPQEQGPGSLQPQQNHQRLRTWSSREPSISCGNREKKVSQRTQAGHLRSHQCNSGGIAKFSKEKYGTLS